MIIAVSNTDLRLSLDLMFREEPGLNVLGTATTPESMLRLIGAEESAILLLEWRLCKGPVEDVLKEIKEKYPGLKIILLGNRTSQVQLDSHFGADAYLQIGGAPQILRSTIKELVS